MAKSTRNYSILVGIKLDTSDVQKQLNEITDKTLKVKLNVDGTSEIKGLDDAMVVYNKTQKEAKEKTEDTAQSVEKLGLTFHQAHAIMSKSIDIISNMLDSVFELDEAMTELKKVSDLGGQALDDYVQKLTQMGQEVGRTGKPKVRAGMYGW